jgi:hypothetical protein
MVWSNVMNLHAQDPQSWIETVWDALFEWQDAHEGRNPAGGVTYEERWDDICTAMAWITEAITEENEG